MKYLVDSNWVINCLRNDEIFLARLTELRQEGVALSIISVAEIYEGIYRRQNPVQDEADFRNFLGDDIQILTLDEEICRIFAREEVRLRRLGMPIGNMDLFIAATAVRHNLIVLTNNRRHIGRVEGLELISITNISEG